MSPADWVRLAVDRATDGTAKLRSWHHDGRFADDELVEAFDQLHTATEHIKDALMLLRRRTAADDER